MGKSRELATLGSKQTAGASSVQVLLQSLLSLSEKVDASAVHIYLSDKAKTCYFEVAGELELTGKKFSDKVLEELVEFIKISSSLEGSDLIQAQSGILRFQGMNINLVYLQNASDKACHLVLILDSSVKPRSLEDLGLWGIALEELESVLDSGKGIVIVDSKDQYTLRSLVGSSIGYLGQGRGIGSVSFDSSNLPTLSLPRHDRIFTKTDKSEPLIRSTLGSNPAAVAFLDQASESALRLAKEYSASGRLVFLVASEGSATGALQKVLGISSENILPELRLVLSASPIQVIAGSNGDHRLDKPTIAQLESFFGFDTLNSWRDIYSRAGIKSPEELLNLEFPVASEHGGVTNLVEVLKPTDYIKRTLIRNPDLDKDTLSLLAIRSGMMTKREDGLIKALRKEVDLADVIDTCR